MIIHKANVVAGVRLDGYEISCSRCPLTSFITSGNTHLPAQVVSNKFRDRGWEVNRGRYHDVCPKCIELKRHKTKTVRGGSIVTPVTEHLPLTASILTKVLTEAGMGGAQVSELDSPHRKFCIAFLGSTEINIGRLIHCEREIVDRFDSELMGSYIKSDLSHVNGGNTVSVTHTFHWIMTLAPRASGAAV